MYNYNMSLDEQVMIKNFYYFIQNNRIDDINNLINTIELEYKNSYILQYYLGFFYENNNKLILAEQAYENSININQLFTPPYFQLCDILLKKNEFKKVENLLISIFNKRTLNPTSPNGDRVYDLMCDLRIATTLIPKYIENNDYNKAEKIINIILPKIEKVKKIEYRHLEIWKNIHFTYANLIINKYHNMEMAHEYYYMGLEGLCSYEHTNSLDINGNLHKLDLLLYQGYAISTNYVLNQKKLNFTINDLYDRYRDKNYINDNNNHHNNINNNKIHIGYLSPDFNKNAVGLFVTSLLKYYNKDKFEIYIYNTCDKYDVFSKMFRSYSKNWFNVHNINDNDLYHIIKYRDKIDILFDLIVLGVPDRLKLIAKKPAPIIINYLGFPDISKLNEFDYRIVDNITDPIKDYSTYEKLIKMPNCFICYTLFEIIQLLPINYKINTQDNNIYIGIMNKFVKHHSIIRKIWLDIIKKRKNYILCIKLGQNENNLPEGMYDDFPKNQIKLLPFTDSLEDYLDQYNKIDFCIDTHPYSGTTTTCSSLLMGVPVFTIYKPDNSKHVENVSTSLIKNTNKFIDDDNNENFICNSLKEYKDRIIKYTFDKNIEQYNRQKRREAFIKSMNEINFMRDFELNLEKIYNL